jgi:arylformamidase
MRAADESQPALIALGAGQLRVDLARPHCIAIELHFDGRQPRWLETAPAGSAPLPLADFSGAVSQGASCNCNTLRLTPHGDGTHTECVGHLTTEPLDAQQIAPRSLLPAVLLSVATSLATTTQESSDPAPVAGDQLITRRALEQGWPAKLPFVPTALVLRTLPNDSSKCTRDYRHQPAAFLSRDAAQWLVEHGIEHLVLDVPSADRAEDGGRLCAHRIFFGLPPGSSRLADARRAQCTITELAYIDDGIADGPYLLMLQLPAWSGDALPSRPLLYAVAEIPHAV